MKCTRNLVDQVCDYCVPFAVAIGYMYISSETMDMFVIPTGITHSTITPDEDCRDTISIVSVYVTVVF